jgi:hypothetical protein
MPPKNKNSNGNYDSSAEHDVTVVVTWRGNVADAERCRQLLTSAKESLTTTDPDVNGCLQDIIDAFTDGLSAGAS